MLLAMLILLPIAIAGVSVALALSCKYHPMTHARIIPADTPIPADGKPESPPDALASDLSSRRMVLMAVGIALGLVFAASLYLWTLTHLGSATVRVPKPPAIVSQVFSVITLNVVIVVLVLFTTVVQFAVISRSFVWMTPFRRVLAIAMAVILVAAWVAVDSWITFDLVSGLTCLILAVCLQTRMSFLRLALMLGIVAVLYDAVQVFGTGNMDKYGSALEPVLGAPERQLTIPAMFIIPSSFSLTPHAYGFLGCGDVVILCLLAIAAARFGRRTGTWTPVVLTFVGFAAAMAVCFTVIRYFQSVQPATIYIVPFCVLPILLYAKQQGTFRQLSVPFYAAAPRDK